MSPTTTTARLTGLAYLGLALSGALGFVLVRQQLYVPSDAAATAANLIEDEGLARLGIAADLTVVLTQALAALLFFLVFRRVHLVAAGALAAFGLVNSVTILVGTACSATALRTALASPAAGGDQAATVQVLNELNGAAWGVGGLFFGLWLIPMGWLAWHSGFMPRALGWVLASGGVGYILSTYVVYLAPGLSGVADALVVPATVGELWMIGVLLLTRFGPGTAAPANDTHRSLHAPA